MSEDDLPPPIPGETAGQYRRRLSMGVRLPVSSAELKPLSPKSPIRVTLWTFGGILAAVFAAGWTAAVRLSAIETLQRQFDERLAAVAQTVQSSDPPHIKEECREVVLRQMRMLTVECPRPVRKGEVVGNCKLVLPLSLQEEGGH